MHLRLPDSTMDLTGRARIMGILNVTPDSFSDGGLYADPALALAHARRLITDGADILDVGGESSRPGSAPVSAKEQILRAVPVIRRLHQLEPGIPISIDTRLSDVAAAAIDAGATIVNDISALRDDPAMASLVAERRAPVVLMHMRGCPRTMQVNPSYRNVVIEVRDFLRERIDAARSAGVAADRIVIDPGLGFGKTTHHNLELIRRIDEFLDLGVPILIGPSRKRFIGDVLNIEDPAERIFGTAGVSAWAVSRGVRIVRVHDVRPIRQVVEMAHAIQRPRPPDRPLASTGEDRS